jgi:hypothetical protein
MSISLKNNSVVCYFNKINEISALSSQSEELINFWSENWRSRGWNPIILNREYAKTHPKYKVLQDSFETDGLLFNPAHNKEYQMECYSRWFAYSQFSNENGATLWSDYDVYNKSLTFDDFVKFPPKTNMISYSGSSGVMDKFHSDNLIGIYEKFNNSDDYSNIKGLSVNQQLHIDKHTTFVSDMILTQCVFLVEKYQVIDQRCTECWTHPDKDFYEFDLYHINGGISDPSNKSQLAFDFPYDKNLSRLDTMKYVESLLK